jgi:hypothetical protein
MFLTQTAAVGLNMVGHCSRPGSIWQLHASLKIHRKQYQKETEK